MGVSVEFAECILELEPVREPDVRDELREPLDDGVEAAPPIVLADSLHDLAWRLYQLRMYLTNNDF